MVASPDGSPNASPLDVERVEWMPVSPDVLEVRVIARWRVPPPASPPALLVDDGKGGRVRFEAAAGAGSDADGVWTASYVTPVEVRPRLGSIALLDGEREIRLPAAMPGHGVDAGAPPPAKIVEPAILDERRARRTEMADESLVRRAQAAEATLETLETQLGHLEARLTAAVSERDDLGRALREAEQREEAERRQREDLEHERDRGENSDVIAGLQARLTAAEDHAARLAAEMDDVRREGAEAEHAAERARRAAARREETAERRLAELDASEAAGATTSAELARVADEARALGDSLAAERRAREDAEASLASERERVAEIEASVALLSSELERRSEVQTSVQVELEELREALVRVRARADEQAETQSRLDALQEVADGMRGRVDELEARERAASSELREARSELERRGRDLARARADQSTAERDLVSARAGEGGRSAALRESERTLMAVREEASQAQRALDEERRRRFESEATLRSQLERERDTQNAQIAEAEGELRVQLAAQRQGFEQQVGGFESTVVELRSRLATAAGELEERLAVERKERENAERARDEALLARDNARDDQRRDRAEAERAASTAAGELRALELARDQARGRADDAVRQARESATAHAAELRRSSQEEHAAHVDALEELRRGHAEELQSRQADHVDALADARHAHASDLREAHAALQSASDEAERLEAAVDERDATIASLQEEIVSLGERIEELLSEALARAQRVEALETQVDGVLDTASRLREGFESQIAELERDMGARVEAERAGFAERLEGVEQRITILRSELEDERTARWVAEEELAGERTRSAEAADELRRRARTAEEQSDEAVTARRAELEAARRELAATQEELAAERARSAESETLHAQAQAMVRDLEAAEARLKAEREALEARAAQAEVEDLLAEVEAETPVAPEELLGRIDIVEPVEPEPVAEPDELTDVLEEAEPETPDAELAEPEDLASEPEPEPEPVAHEPELGAPLDLEPPATADEPELADAEPVVDETPIAPPPEPEPSSRRRRRSRGEDPFGLLDPEGTSVPEAELAPEPGEDDEALATGDPLESLARELAEGDATETPDPVKPDLSHAGPVTHPSRPSEAGTLLTPRVIALDARRPLGWLAPAIEVLAQEDEEGAAQLVAELLAALGPGIVEDLAFAVSIDGLGTYRVDVAKGGGRAEQRGGAGAAGEVDVHVAGPAGALAPLVAGGAGRRLRGARVEGSRRKLKKILKARREPVTLVDIAAQRVAVDPRLLLAALTIAVDPAWTQGYRFIIAWDLDGEAGGPWVVVRDGEPVQVLGDQPVGEQVAATISLARSSFLPLLGRLWPPPGERVTVHGDVRAVELLGAWLDRAQGLPAD